MRTYVNQAKLDANCTGRRALNKPVGYGFIDGDKLVAFVATDANTGAVKYDVHGDPALNWRRSRSQ